MRGGGDNRRRVKGGIGKIGKIDEEGNYSKKYSCRRRKKNYWLNRRGCSTECSLKRYW